MTVIGSGGQAVQALMALLNSVCPNDGVTINDPANLSTATIVFDVSSTPAQQQAAQAILNSFNLAGETQFQSALVSGLTMTWTVSTALNDTYAIDALAQIRMLAERVSVAVNSTFTNGTTTLTWFGMTGTQHTMTVAQAGLFVRAVWQYLSALYLARAVSASGGVPSFPSSTVSITG